MKRGYYFFKVLPEERKACVLPQGEEHITAKDRIMRVSCALPICEEVRR